MIRGGGGRGETRNCLSGDDGIHTEPTTERRVRPLSAGDRRIKDVEDTFNYLSRQDWREAKLRGFDEMGKKENEFFQAQLRERQARRAELEEAELAGRS